MQGTAHVSSKSSWDATEKAHKDMKELAKKAIDDEKKQEHKAEIERYQEGKCSSVPKESGVAPLDPPRLVAKAPKKKQHRRTRSRSFNDLAALDLSRFTKELPSTQEKDTSTVQSQAPVTQVNMCTHTIVELTDA